jgi:hypothetical protein
MRYKEPKAKVVHASRRDDVITVVVEVSSLFSEPLAPGGLYLIGKPEQEIMQLHSLKATNGNAITYETYDYAGELPTVGAEYIYRVWWTPGQIAAVTDTSRKWSYEEYPDNGDHDHCLLTGETIAADAEQKAGYRSGKDWITEEAYKTYIVDDKLRIRHRGKNN